ncbi:MAG: glucosidase [Bacteroidota bacterium]|nr:glucosidase [Bacteroidota bacterium]
MPNTSVNPEFLRIHSESQKWKKFGPYLSERQWGTVREDYSEYGSAWDFFPHDDARSRAYRWGEDGIAGISDDHQNLCFAIAFWNGKDGIIKERLFGLTGEEGNHSEDVKELYYYLASTPTHSYMKYLYKYPQNEFPYWDLVLENANRSKKEKEFELVDTGIFDQNKYFDIEIEYAKIEEEKILVKITVHNRSVDASELHIIPTIWFRNTWRYNSQTEKPTLRENNGNIEVESVYPGKYILKDISFGNPDYEIVLTENETNAGRLYGLESYTKYVKDGINNYIVHGNDECVNPSNEGTKAAYIYKLKINGGESKSVCLQLTDIDDTIDIEKTLSARRGECEYFYNKFSSGNTDIVELLKQAYAGMMWGKQFYHFNLKQWFNGDPGQHPPPENRKNGRNSGWEHIDAHDIISMPDKWEYPWFAAWDSAFHCIAIARIDPVFAKNQLIMFLEPRYMSRSGQIPAYEWAFGDVNPPVHSLGVWHVYQIDKTINGGKGDLEFLNATLQGLEINFDWWFSNQKIGDKYVFSGGFMGLDNVSVIDRGANMPDGTKLAQVDATCWMAAFALDLLKICIETNQSEEKTIKYLNIFNQIASDFQLLWDNETLFFVDKLVDAQTCEVIETFRVKNISGLFPIMSVVVLEKSTLRDYPVLTKHLNFDNKNQCFLSLITIDRMLDLVGQLSDETKFLGKYGIRSLSYEHANHTLQSHLPIKSFPLRYTPEESETTNYGENSNWRGPVWFPVNYVLLSGLSIMGKYFQNQYTVHYEGTQTSITFLSKAICQRLLNLFIRKNNHTPIYTNYPKLNSDPNFYKHLQFYEFFNPETGAGCGASHQTGWTGLVTEVYFLTLQ